MARLWLIAFNHSRIHHEQVYLQQPSMQSVMRERNCEANKYCKFLYLLARGPSKRENLRPTFCCPKILFFAYGTGAFIPDESVRHHTNVS